MCENPDSRTTLRKLEEISLMEYQRGEGQLKVDDTNAYFKGKAIPKEVWWKQAFQMRLPADIYLDIAALAKNEAGIHTVGYGGLNYLVEVNGIIQSKYGQHRVVKSVIPSES